MRSSSTEFGEIRRIALNHLIHRLRRSNVCGLQQSLLRFCSMPGSGVLAVNTSLDTTH